MTSKGELIRAILFPKPADFKFYQDILKCALLIGVFGLAGTIYSTYAWIMNGVFNSFVFHLKRNGFMVVLINRPPWRRSFWTRWTWLRSLCRQFYRLRWRQWQHSLKRDWNRVKYSASVPSTSVKAAEWMSSASIKYSVHTWPNRLLIL